MVKRKKNWKWFWVIFTLFIFVIGTFIWIVFSMFNSVKEDWRNLPNSAEGIIKLSEDSAFVKASISLQDSNIKIIRVSSLEEMEVPFQIDANAGSFKRVFSGKRINIAIIGVDSRLNTSYKHADANHVVSILIDSGLIEITAIPRDTPVETFIEDSTIDTLQNKLTVLYAYRGKTAYFEEIAKIAGVDKIHYYIEVGFSQARGILELLGFKDTGSALQVLRSRTGIIGNDFQRCYNQAQFIRQMFLKHFDKFTGFFSRILINGSLALVETNLTSSKVVFIFDRLKKKGFPKSKNDIIIRVRPPMEIKYRIYDFTDNQVVSSLTNQIEEHNPISSNSSMTMNSNRRKKFNASDMLWKKIELSIADSSDKPWKVISCLKTLFNQRAWLQVSDLHERANIRDEIGILLHDAYVKRKKLWKAEKVLEVIEAERKLFAVPIFKTKLESDTSESF